MVQANEGVTVEKMTGNVFPSENCPSGFSPDFFAQEKQNNPVIVTSSQG